MDEVDDMFRSFVSDKLKQLGLKGVDEPTAKLEESLKKSAMNSKAVAAKRKISDNSFDEQSDTEVKSKKQKKTKHKKKKKKKHKEKKRKVSSNANPERRSDVSEACRSTHGALKKKLLVADDEDNIFTEKKAATCYYDTVNKLKEIEKLSLNVKLEKSPSAIRTKRELVSDAVASNEITTAENSESRCAEKTAPTPASKTDSILTSVKEAKALLPEQAAEKYETNCSESNCVSKPQLSLKSNFNGVSNKLDSQQGELEKNETKRETIPVTSASAATTAVALKPSSENRTSFENDAVVQTKLQAIKETLKNCNKTNSKLKKKRSRRPRSRSRSSSHTRSKRSKRSRSKSKSDRHKDRRRRSRSKDRHHRHKSSRHRKRSLSPFISSEDKMKLLEIAKANVLAQHRADSTMNALSQESKAVLRSGGVTVAQLTGICKEIAEGRREVSAGPLVPDVPDGAKIHHPFQVREAASISINLKSASSIPPVSKPISELSKQFPVSTGSHHQRIEPKETVYGKWQLVLKEDKDANGSPPEENQPVFPDPPPDNSSLIKEAIAQRVRASRTLQSDPGDDQAKKTMVASQEKLDTWTSSQQMLGRFTGSTSLQPLPRSELERGQAAWANNKSLNAGKQVEGIGKSLLEKMGWQEGRSLGKTNAGLLEPLKVTVKTDRKGLSSIMEAPAPSNAARRPKPPTVKDMSGKHPVSALMEICSKRRWPPPDFQVVMDSGPDHSRHFLFKVRVNNCEYQASNSALNKKLAKADAAASALRGMGLLS